MIRSGSWGEKKETTNMTILPAKDVRWWQLTVRPHHHHYETTNLRSRKRVSLTSGSGIETKNWVYNNFNCIIIIESSAKTYFST